MLGRTLRTSIMSAELIAVLCMGATVLVGLGGLMIGLQLRLEKRFDAMEARLAVWQAELR